MVASPAQASRQRWPFPRPPARGGPTIYDTSTSRAIIRSIVGPPLAGGLSEGALCGWPSIVAILSPISLPQSYPRYDKPVEQDNAAKNEGAYRVF